jgi:hypothetical protein
MVGGGYFKLKRLFARLLEHSLNTCTAFFGKGDCQCDIGWLGGIYRLVKVTVNVAPFGTDVTVKYLSFCQNSHTPNRILAGIPSPNCQLISSCTPSIATHFVF